MAAKIDPVSNETLMERGVRLKVDHIPMRQKGFPPG